MKDEATPVGRLSEDRSLEHSEMDLFVAPGTQSDQVFVRVIAEQTARSNVMNLEFPLTPALLAAPPVSLQHSFVQYLVRLLIEPQPGTFR
jgi:hypothetical protein